MKQISVGNFRAECLSFLLKNFKKYSFTLKNLLDVYDWNDVFLLWLIFVLFFIFF